MFHSRVVSKEKKSNRAAADVVAQSKSNSPVDTSIVDNRLLSRDFGVMSAVAGNAVGVAQARLTIDPDTTPYNRRKRKGGPVEIPQALRDQVFLRVSKKDAPHVIELIQDWADDAELDKQFASYDAAVFAAMDELGVSQLNVYQGDEQPLYVYGKDYSDPESDKAPTVDDGSGISETDDSRRLAQSLLAKLEELYQTPPSDFTQADFLPGGQPYMIGVLVTSRDNIVASKSGNECRGFSHAVQALGFKLAKTSTPDLKGFFKQYAISAQKKTTPSGHNHAYGGCALPKVVSRSSGLGGYPVGVTEMYFSPASNTQSVTAIGEGGGNQNFFHGTVVPSCDRCRDFAPEQIHGMNKKKGRSTGAMEKPKKMRVGKSRSKLRVTDSDIDEARGQIDFEDGYDDGFYDGRNEGYLAGEFDFQNGGERQSYSNSEAIAHYKGEYGEGYNGGYFDGYDTGYNEGVSGD